MFAIEKVATKNGDICCNRGRFYQFTLRLDTFSF